jgi:hypothetical protein
MAWLKNYTTRKKKSHYPIIMINTEQTFTFIDFRKLIFPFGGGCCWFLFWYHFFILPFFIFFSVYGIMVSLFFMVQVANNAAYGFNISMQRKKCKKKVQQTSNFY